MPYVPNDSSNIIVGDPGVAAVGNKGTATVSDRDSDISQTINFLQNPSLAGATALYGADIFPFRNELDQFASYSPIFTLGCLTNIEFNFPLSYRTLGPAVKIIRSGGGGGPTIPSLYDLDGKREFFIEDVVIKNTVAPNPKTRHSNATAINFKVIEPYSMGQFFHNLRSASLVTGHANYLEAPFLISVAFIGYDDDGNVKSPFFSQRHFPIQIVQAEMSVSESGATYDIKAVPYTEKAVTNRAQRLKTDVAIKGRTVAEILQNGPQSLTAAINQVTAEQKSALQSSGDSYVIQFPNTSVLGALGGVVDGLASVASAVTGSLSAAGGAMNEWYQGLVGGDNSPPPRLLEKVSENTAVFSLGSLMGDKLRLQAKTDINEIGRSQLLRPGTQYNLGNTPYQLPSFAEDPSNPGFLKRDLISYNPQTSVYQFEQGSRILDIIEEILITSQYGRDFANKPGDMAGQKRWFRIEPQVYNGGGLLGGLITGRSPKTYVYRVRPYKTDGSNFSAPGFTGFSRTLIKQLLTPKAYSYIYTGQNKDIIDFDLRFNMMYYTGVQAARNQKQLASVLGGALIPGPKDRDAITTTGANPNALPVSVPGGTLEDDTALTDNEQGANGGNAAGDDPETGTARYFNDMMINSGNDLLQVDLKIHGDPYFIADVGVGNFLGLPSSPLLPVTLDGSMNPMDGEVYVILNFRTPIDYDEEDGYVKYPLGGFLPVSMFSGIFQVIQVENNFENGKFEQTLKLARKRNQDISIEAVAGKVISFLMGGKGNAQETSGLPFVNHIGRPGPDETT